MLFEPDKTPDIKQEDLELLIQNMIEESIHLDYKDPQALNNNAEVAKDISSFANSDGGNIIYGIFEDRHKPSKIIPINEEGLREKIDQIAQNGIDPPLNIKIWPVDVNVEGKIGQVFVIFVPKRYPYLHYAKKNNRFYKRTNFTSTPMSRYEIDVAYRLRLEISEKFKNTISIVKKDFIKEIGHRHYKFVFCIYPTQVGEKLFKITKDLRRFLYEIFPKTPIYKNNLFLRRSRLDMPEFRQDAFFFKSDLGYHNADCLIRTDGIILYILHFYNFSQGELEKIIGRIYKSIDYYESLSKGIILNNRTFDKTFFLDYFLGLLNFIFIFYSKVGYFGDIKLSLEIEGALSEWIEEITGNKFTQLKVDPIENEINVEMIPNMKIDIVRKFFTPIFNGFGIMDEDLESYYKKLESNLNE